MTVDEVTINKYVEGITVINSTLGRLDVLRLHLQDDKMALAIVDTIIDDLSKVCGVNYNKINYIVEKIEPKINVDKDIKVIPTVEQPKQTTINIVEKSENKGAIARITQLMDDLKIKENKMPDFNGVEVDGDELIYNFKNSNTLKYMSYNKNKNRLIVMFSKNGRVYEYKNVPIYVFDNMANLDDRGQSANSYFQQNICKKWTKGQYKEIDLIG